MAELLAGGVYALLIIGAFLLLNFLFSWVRFTPTIASASSRSALVRVRFLT